MLRDSRKRIFGEGKDNWLSICVDIKLLMKVYIMCLCCRALQWKKIDINIFPEITLLINRMLPEILNGNLIMKISICTERKFWKHILVSAFCYKNSSPSWEFNFRRKTSGMSLKSEERECEDVKSVAIVRAPTYFALCFAAGICHKNIITTSNWGKFVWFGRWLGRLPTAVGCG